jgi:hypothetical protein
MVEALAVALIFGTPLVAILSFTALRWKKLHLQEGGGMSKEQQQQLLALAKSNAELQARVETLESIVVDQDHRKLGVAGARALSALEEQEREQAAVAVATRRAGG